MKYDRVWDVWCIYTWQGSGRPVEEPMEGEWPDGGGKVHNLPMKMELIECSETSAIRTQTPGNYPKENTLHIEHGESLKWKKHW